MRLSKVCISRQSTPKNVLKLAILITLGLSLLALIITGNLSIDPGIDPYIHSSAVLGILYSNNIPLSEVGFLTTIFNLAKSLMKYKQFDRTAIIGPGNSSVYEIQQKLLDCLGNGKYISRADTKQEQRDALWRVLQENVWPNLQIPANISRTDGKCGNISIERHWVRALCDPYSHKACCYNYQCTSKVENKCRCENCYDLRQRIYPEFADYKLGNKKCKMTEMVAGAACAIFRKKNIEKLLVIGDSLARHLYSGFLISLRENLETGALGEGESEVIKSQCAGFQQFTEKMCRHHIEWFGTVCDGHLTVEMVYANHHGDARLAVNSIKRSPTCTLIINSIGMHSNYNSSLIKDSYLDPIMVLIKLKQLIYTEENASQTEKWPKYVWVTPHLPGLLKGPKFIDQEEKPLREYSEKMAEYFKKRHICIFTTFNVTRDVFSWDGTHYGRELNMLLAQILMTFIDG